MVKCKNDASCCEVFGIVGALILSMRQQLYDLYGWPRTTKLWENNEKEQFLVSNNLIVRHSVEVYVREISACMGEQ